MPWKSKPTATRPPTSRKRAPTPVKPARTASERLERAYEVLGVQQADVQALPQISHVLTKSFGKKYFTVTLEFLRGYADPDARTFLSTYDSIPETVRKLLPIEAFCLASALKPRRLLELVQGASFEQSTMSAELMSAAANPDIIKATIRNAKSYQGAADRKLLLQHSGFAPMPKNNVTNVFGGGKIVGGDDNSKNLSISVGAVNQIEDKMARITNRFNVERLGLAAAEDAPNQTDDTDTPNPNPEDIARTAVENLDNEDYIDV